MFTILSRIFHFGLKNFSRNGWLSTATVAILTLALIVFGSLILFSVITQAAASSIQDKIDISVYFKTNTSEDQILSIEQSLQGLPEVDNVAYISRDQALALFQQAHAADPTISEAINELNSNPLEASLSVKAKDPNQYATIANYLASPDLAQYIDSVSYTQNQNVIERLAKIINLLDRGGWAATLILVIIASLVMFNTIRMSIYASREEIGIMRVVGASNSLVRGPFVVDGMLCGLIAAFASMILITPALYFASPYLNYLIPGLNLFQYFYSHIAQLLLYEVLFGVLVAGFSSFFAVRRYLKN
jgi:cell division transport system permease protein